MTSKEQKIYTYNYKHSNQNRKLILVIYVLEITFFAE